MAVSRTLARNHVDREIVATEPALEKKLSTDGCNI